MLSIRSVNFEVYGESKMIQLKTIPFGVYQLPASFCRSISLASIVRRTYLLNCFGFDKKSRVVESTKVIIIDSVSRCRSVDCRGPWLSCDRVTLGAFIHVAFSSGSTLLS